MRCCSSTKAINFTCFKAFRALGYWNLYVSFWSGDASVNMRKMIIIFIILQQASKKPSPWEKTDIWNISSKWKLKMFFLFNFAVSFDVVADYIFNRKLTMRWFHYFLLKLQTLRLFHFSMFFKRNFLITKCVKYFPNAQKGLIFSQINDFYKTFFNLDI